MFKRLAKSKRHSPDGAGGESRPTAAAAAPDSAPPSPEGSTLSPDAPSVGGARAPRAKQARRSCGDQQPLHRSKLLQPPDDRETEGRDADRESSPRVTRVNSGTDDYQMVTAVPAYIVEHEPEKQKGLGVWGRRMSKKIDSFRRSSCRDSPSPADTANPEKPRTPDTRRFSSPAVQMRSSHSPFKSFFIRMGSTGMLNSTKSNRRSLQVLEDRNPPSATATAQGTTSRSNRTPEKDQNAPLFRSCSTSQLNTSPTYVKGDDPSEGIDLRMSGKDHGKTVSCDNLAAQMMQDDVFEPVENSGSTTNRSSSATFQPCDFADGPHRGELHMVRKSVSCEFREQKDAVKKTNFPYAFLRSKLSVLPEEKNGVGHPGSGFAHSHHSTLQSQEDRLFKTLSEEHFPSLLRVEDCSETTTLGRRRSRPGGASSAAYFKVGGRNSYSEYRSPSYDLQISPSSIPCVGQDRVDFTGDFGDLETVPNSLTTTTQLRCQRRNSVPSAEQRLSSHYVSSNESGYDSDGPRGESAAASEAEALSLNRADSSDTSSVVDSEIEKPTRSSTPSEYADNVADGVHVHVHHHHHHQSQVSENGLEGLRWHQTTSGRILPSINQTSGSDSAVKGRMQECGNPSASHRVKLQRDRTKFLSDIIRPTANEKMRRCRIVNLTKNDPKESLGIRLAQQRTDRLSYVVVELENQGIAHRDGRLRLGDEIVEVEGRDLSTLDSLQAVQDFLASFRSTRVQLLTSYEESVPQVCDNSVGLVLLPGETEYFENAKTLSNISLGDERPSHQILQVKDKPRSPVSDRKKRPDYLPLNSVRSSNDNDRKNLTIDPIIQDHDSPADILLEAHRYLTRHLARFEKGYGRPSLGFSVVGGRDSPRGEMGIFVRRVFPGGQADVSKSLLQGDEILTLNGKILRGYTHREVIELFKAVREGAVELEIARRHRYPKSATESSTY